MPKISVGETDVLILCGGLGNRFRKVRNDIPKALAPINGKPFIDLLLDDLVSQGLTRIILATGYLSNLVEQHIKQRSDIEYIISCEPKPLGTGGAIKFAERHFRSNPVLVMNGDSRISFNFKNLLKTYFEQDCDALILLSNNTNGEDYGNVTMDNTGRICGFSEKPLKKFRSEFVNAGVYLFSRKLIHKLPPNKTISLEKDLMTFWLKKGKHIYGIVVNNPVQDIGTRERYNNLKNTAMT